MEEQQCIPFGSSVRDRITKFEGVVVCRIEHMHGCIRYIVQPVVDKEKQLPKSKSFNGLDLDIIAPPKSDLPPAVKTTNAFELGVTAEDILTGFTGVIVARVKSMYAGDRYGIQPPINGKGEVPELSEFDEGDLRQIDPPPKKKKVQKEPKVPFGPRDPDSKLSR